MSAHRHQLSKEDNNCCIVLESGDIAIASSAYCNHVVFERSFTLLHEKPSAAILELLIVRKNGLIHKLNKVGERGSPCNTPLRTLTGADHSSLTATEIRESL